MHTCFGALSPRLNHKKICAVFKLVFKHGTFDVVFRAEKTAYIKQLKTGSKERTCSAHVV